MAGLKLFPVLISFRPYPSFLRNDIARGHARPHIRKRRRSAGDDDQDTADHKFKRRRSQDSCQYTYFYVTVSLTACSQSTTPEIPSSGILPNSSPEPTIEGDTELEPTPNRGM